MPFGEGRSFQVTWSRLDVAPPVSPSILHPLPTSTTLHRHSLILRRSPASSSLLLFFVCALRSFLLVSLLASPISYSIRCESVCSSAVLLAPPSAGIFLYPRVSPVRYPLGILKPPRNHLRYNSRRNLDVGRTLLQPQLTFPRHWKPAEPLCSHSIISLKRRSSTSSHCSPLLRYSHLRRLILPSISFLRRSLAPGWTIPRNHKTHTMYTKRQQFFEDANGNIYEVDSFWWTRVRITTSNVADLN